MAYFSQEMKQKIAPKMKALLKQYGMKGSLSVSNHTQVVLTLKSGPIDFSPNKGVNIYWIQEHYQGVAQEFLLKAKEVLRSADWFDKSDASIDYFHTAYYIDIRIGKWNKPYELTR